MSKLSGESATEQEAELKEKDEQIKEIEKIIGQQKVQMYINNSGQWVYMFDIIDVYTREIADHHEGLRCRTKEALKVL